MEERGTGELNPPPRDLLGKVPWWWAGLSKYWARRCTRVPESDSRNVRISLVDSILFMGCQVDGVEMCF